MKVNVDSPGFSKNFPKTFCGNLIVFPETSPNLWGFQGARYHVYIVEFYTTLGMAPGGQLDYPSRILAKLIEGSTALDSFEKKDKQKFPEYKVSKDGHTLYQIS
jgi:hypothetical protein